MITLALIICIVGLIIYVLPDSAGIPSKLVEVGRIMFWTGLLAYLLGASGKALL